MSISTGTPETRTEHSKTMGGLSVGLAVAIPAALALIGLVSYGFGGISWLGAIVWGFVATLAMTAFLRLGQSMGITRMDLPDLLGSMSAEPGTSSSQSTGMAVHFTNGILLAVAWAYTMTLLGWATNWLTGMLWGAFIGILALLLFSGIGTVHPAIREKRQDDPGTAGMNFGSMTPLGVILAHLVYGFVLGIMYQWLPLA